MKKVLIWILVLVLAAGVSIIGTIAYLTAVDDETNVMTVGDASIKILEYERVNTDDKNTNAAVQAFNNNKHLRPSVLANGATYAAPDTSYNANLSVDNEGNAIKANYTYSIWNPNNITNEIDKMVFVKNTGDCNVYVRLCFAFEAGNYVRLDRFKEMVHLNANETDWTWDWNDTRLVDIDGTRYFIAWATYQKPVAPGELTDISLAQIALDYTAINDHARAFGDTYDVKVFAQGIQSDGFTNASAALSNGFDNSIPFKNVKFVEFVDLPNALHYLKGNTNAMGFVGSSSNPNTRVSSITFGLTADHAEKVKGYDGTLVANGSGEADFTAYAYYIPNSDGQYDIYVLADAWEIYAPKNYAKLFGDMAGVKTIDTTNLNVSQAQTMKEWFNRCKALETIDVSDWDVSNVTDMQYMFNQCGKLANIDVSNWDVSNVTNMNYMFRGCPITTLDVADWDVSKVTDMGEMFWQCGSLTNLDLSTWKTDSLTKISKMFQGCGALTDLNISTWDVSKVTSMAALCYSCASLPSLDISQWKLNQEKDVNMSNMFFNCFALIELDLPKEGTDKVTNMSSMFEGCHALASLDLSGWDTGSVTTMNKMFFSCGSLSSLKLPNDVSEVTNMESMFMGCRALTELDLSAWDTTNVTDMSNMFNMGDYAGDLAKIYVGDKWTVANVTSSDNMFKNCKNLVGGNGTKFSESNPTDKTHAHAGEGGYLTLK